MTLLLSSPNKHFPEATKMCRQVIPLLYAAFRQSVPSQILFSLTSGFVASYLNTANFHSEWPLKLVSAALIPNVKSKNAFWGALIAL